jgi:hypothetical protein
MASAMSRRALTWPSKGKHRLSLGPPANRFLEGVGGGQIDLHAEQVSQVVFQLDHVDQREPAPGLKLGDQVDVGIRRRFSTCDGTMEAQVDDPRSTQFCSVCPELFNDLQPLHTSTVPYRVWVDNSLRERSVCGLTVRELLRLAVSVPRFINRHDVFDKTMRRVNLRYGSNGVAIVESGGRMRGIVPQRYSTSTLIDSASCVPWLAADGPLAYTPENPPPTDYFFQYSWILPEIFDFKFTSAATTISVHDSGSRQTFV